jgi:heat-inducible transcriptional repressor
MLASRADIILKTLVTRYIAQAAPVSSQSLISDGELDVSSATIRNELARLEKSGYIIKPYTSAGSIPTDKGYRYYVESLTTVVLPLEEQRLIVHLFHQVERRMDEWLALAAALIARLSNNMAIVTGPKPADCKFKHIELVALQDSSALVVLVLYGARIKQRLVLFDRPVSQPELSEIAGKLRTRYAGLTGAEISRKTEELLPEESVVTDCLVEMMAAEDKSDYGEPYFDGLHFMLNQPEFLNNPHLADMVEMVEHKNMLSAVLPPGFVREGVRVFIGKENKAEVAHNYSLVISRYGLLNEVTGTVGVIGPTRMPYGRTISAVSYLAQVLNRLIGELYGVVAENQREYPADKEE